MGSVLSTRDSAVKKAAENLCPLGTCILMGTIAVLRYFILLNSSLYVGITLSLSVDGHLECFYVLAIVSGASVNTGVRVICFN